MNIIKFNNSILKYDGKWLETDGTPTPTPVDPYNPLNLPPNTVRVRTSDGNVPYKDVPTSYQTATLVPGTSDVYDVYKGGTYFTYLLYGSNNVIEVLGANTTGITVMERMFYECYSLTSVPLFDTSSVTSMRNMFADCISLTSVPLFDTSKVTDMLGIFSGCVSLTSIPLFNTSSVTDMTYMFQRTHITSVPLFNTSSVTRMVQMFNLCSSLTTVPLFDTSKVTDMREMFYNCTSLTSIPLFNTSNVTNMGGMFYGCRKVESGALALYQQASSQANPPSNHSYTFTNCGSNTTTGAAELAQIPSDWK